MVHFNPRPREEGDNLDHIEAFDLTISIHALVKRATVQEQQHTIITRHFNPRPREEGDWTRGFRSLKARYFNPRPREEGDDTIINGIIECIPFQSTPS